MGKGKADRKKIDIVYGNILRVNGKFLQRTDMPAIENVGWPTRGRLADLIEPVVREALVHYPSVWFARLAEDLDKAFKDGIDIGNGTNIPFASLLSGGHGMQESLRKLGFGAELRIASSDDRDMVGLCVLATLLKPYQAESLVYMVYASNTCYCEVVDQPPPGVEVDLVRGLWSQPRTGYAPPGARDTFLIGEGPYDTTGAAAIGVYDRTDTDQLGRMTRKWGELVRGSYRTLW